MQQPCELTAHRLDAGYSDPPLSIGVLRSDCSGTQRLGNDRRSSSRKLPAAVRFDVAWSRATYNTPSGHSRKPRELGNSTDPLGDTSRTGCSSVASYYRMVPTAAHTPNGYSLPATILSLGEIAISGGLSSGSPTNQVIVS